MPVSPLQKSLSRSSEVCALIAAWLASVLGVVVLLGWLLHNEALKAIIPGSEPLKINIAVGFALSGISLILLSRRHCDSRIRTVVATLAALIALLGGLTLAEYLFNRDLIIENWVSPARIAMEAPHPGRMQPTTAFCFLVMGVALFAQAKFVSRRFGSPLAAGFGASLVIIGILALSGFIFEKSFGPQWNLLGMTVSGISAAIGFTLLGGSLLFLLQGKGELGWWLDRVSTTAFVVAILLTLLSTAAAYTFAKKMLTTDKWVAHREEVLKEIEGCTTALIELLDSERAYVIMGDEQLLKDRDKTIANTTATLATIRRLTSDNPSQQQRLDQIEPRISDRIGWEEKVIAARRTQGLPIAREMIAGGPGIRLSDEIQNIFDKMKGEEYRLLKGDRRNSESAATTTFLLLPLGIFLSITTLSLAAFLLNRGLAEEVRALSELRESEARYRSLFRSNPNSMWVYDCETFAFLAVNTAALRHYGYSEEEFLAMTIKDIRPREDWPALMEDLAETTEPMSRTKEWRHRRKDGTLIDTEITSHEVDWLGRRARLVLINDITDRKRAEKAIRQLNLELEARVKQRTAELEAANKELEAFSYSVSHDLRAPLRAVDGFSQAVLEDYGAELPESGRRYLETIRQGAQQMGTLIDDLLAFSRLSRLPLEKQQVAPVTVVQSALDELRPQQNGRKIDVRVGDLPKCEADPRLLKQVWVNLLSNAMKYTGRRDRAVVEVGAKSENGEKIYFVADNGTGFDMQYAHKLFGVFQRLHRADEFEGTGVGLAIVQRVVHRHRGRVWAEAQPDRGATFYFTIGTEGTA